MAVSLTREAADARDRAALAASRRAHALKDSFAGPAVESRGIRCSFAGPVIVQPRRARGVPISATSRMPVAFAWRRAMGRQDPRHTTALRLGARTMPCNGSSTHGVLAEEADLLCAFFFVMVDADVGFNELIDAGLIEVVELIQSGPGGKGNAAVHVGVRREDQMDIFFVGLRALLVFQQDAFKLFDEVGASFGALVINHDPAVLEVVDKIFFGNDLIIGAPGRNAGHVRSGGRGLAVIRRVWIAQSLNMHIAQVRNVLAGRFAGWSGGS